MIERFESKTAWRRALVLVLVTAALLVVACGSEGGRAGSGADGSIEQERLTAAVEGLCEAEALAAAGDVDRAGTVFMDRAHQFLHDLAPVVQEEDPAAAGEMLEAKNRVETALRGADPDASGEIAGLMDELTAAVREAAATLGMEAPACDQ